ncbi:SDR family NAD(P)-dependent oxidoreductase [Stackebrandtia nassauensis]|uniref:Short-chain dehydrogenase/reductase SDR n=1 Tax=Stackebrandtia nassauensis (strain DSM 44728 / CIP 108903 / NRRL B-16338 / NBRC 102104 / LLR-40K-21) TaxID=446470 RepID=D3QAN5_STANL|nr:SDR family NAD(P)-dependent oxidoreductase [Stackebrandtia nassauensis]ADD44681.1 short-chain dehydrogenase/reductase SDR [Stackebrandtia nassauensis DSM 44728]
MSLNSEREPRTIVITGGTDGMGKALGLHYLRRGDRVVAIGTDADKGARFEAEAEALDARDRATFLRADLSLVAENNRVLAELTTRFPSLDAVILGARYYRSTRAETPEGIEHNFALFYLSRYLFSHGLVEPLARNENPVILNLAGPGGELSALNWDDPQFRRGYRPDLVMAQCGKLCDLLGVDFTLANPDTHIRYVLAHPGLTASGFTGQYSPADAELVAAMRERGQPLDVAVDMLRRHIDDPDPEPLSAYMQHDKLDVTGPAFDPTAARRLAGYATRTLSAVASA